MSRQQVYQEMESMMGVVPTFLKSIPDDTIDAEWQLFKHAEMEDGPIPLKYRHLIGLSMMAVTKCKYCLFYHTEMAKLHGATQAEIEAAAHYAKSCEGWSTYITEMSTDFEQFKTEVRKACDYVRSQQKQPVSV